MSDWIAFQIAGDEGLPLVFMHGLEGDAEQWRPQLDAFSGHYRAIAWDMPGYGSSAPLRTMSVDGLVESAVTLFDRLSISGAHLVGHSIGGVVAQHFARRYPDRLRSLTLVATGAAFGLKIDGTIDLSWRRQFIEQRLGALDRGASLVELAPKHIRGIVGDRADPKALEQAVLSMADLAERGYRAAINCLTDIDLSNDLADITIPTLLIAGEKDPIAPPSAMAKLASRVPGARFEILSGCGHLANLERPDNFNKVLGAFLPVQSLIE